MTPDATLLHGDCLEMLRGLPDNSVDAVVTDPPAGIAFMGKSWDTDKGGRDAWIRWLADVMSECRRVMKPGAHALVWALPRTSHWTGMALEDAGLEVRDACAHLFGSGFPKSLDVSKAIDKAANAERRVLSTYKGATNIGKGSSNSYIVSDTRAARTTVAVTEPATYEAHTWQGWGTALKPSMELWWLARKPLAAGTVAANVLAYGTGALNITACRAGDEVTITQVKDFTAIHGNKWGTPRASTPTLEYKENPPGRWPPNVLLSHSLFCAPDACSPDCPVRVLGEQSGYRPTSGRHGKSGSGKPAGIFGMGSTRQQTYFDDGSAARFFPNFPPDPADAVPFLYAAKASRSERNQGCDGLPEVVAGGLEGRRDGSLGAVTHSRNSHPTVKSQALMSWLVRLITPPGGAVLDPFMGSGSTGVAAIREGFGFIGIEREAEYYAIAEARIAHATRQRAA